VVLLAQLIRYRDRCEDIKATEIKYTGRGEEGPVEIDLATRLKREAEKGNV